MSTCKGTFLPPGEALSVGPPVTIDLYQRRIRDVTTLASNDWHLSVVVCLHLSCCAKQPVLSQDAVHMHKILKSLQRNLFINDILPISTLSLHYKDGNSSKIKATHLNAKKSVLILQKQSLLLSKLMTYHTMCFVH